MRVLVCVKRVPFTGGKIMSGNLGVSPALSRGGPKGIRSTAAPISTAASTLSAGFAALLTFPGMGSSKEPLLATPGGKLDKVVAGMNPATSAAMVSSIS